MLNLINMVDRTRTRTSSCFKHFYAITVVVILLQLNVNPSIGCIQRERQALLALKRGFVDHYNRLSSWGSREAAKQDCCAWEGVRCSNRTGHVVELHLGYSEYPSKPLGGKLTPQALTEFHYLKYLDLSWNSFGGILPSELGNLTNLQYLDLRFNQFTKVENLNWLPNLSSLQYLDLSDVNLSHVFDWSQAVDKLPQLRNLLLYDCDLPPPSTVSSVSKTNLSHSLAYVGISGSPAISSSIFEWLFNYNSSLVYLVLDSIRFSGSLSPKLGNLTNLPYLYLYDADFTEVENLNWLPNLSSLQYLDLFHVNLSHVFDWSQAVDKLPQLRNLSLWDCDLPPPSTVSSVSKTNLSHSLAHVKILGSPAISSSIFEWLLNYNSSLVYLRLDSIRFSGSLSPKLGNLTNLQYLYLYDADFTEVENLNWLPNLSSLQYLDLFHVNLSHVFDWSQAVDKLPQLRNLSLWDCDLPPPSTVSSVSKTNLSHSLAHVDILGSPAIASSIFEWLFNYNSSLVYLGLGNNNLSGQISELVELLSKHSQNSLELLDLSSNHFTGSLPNQTNFPSLEVLRLDDNKLSGTIPASIGQMSKLRTISVGGNSLQGEISEVHFSKLSSLKSLDLSSILLVLNFSSEWVPPFQLDIISLRSCKMGPYFPLWLRTQKKYTYLDISNAEISGPLPDWFWGQSPNLPTVDLSANKLTGLIATSSRPKFPYYYSKVDLSHNQFEGPIPSFLSRVSSLDLSNNRFSELTSFLCATEASMTVFLNISSNRISGELPDCRMHYANLVFLDLSHNALSGKVPATMGSLSSIVSLKLNSNGLEGELPSSLKKCRNLNVLDVGENKLSGSIPEWLGSGLPNLAFLMFRSNQFNGSMPRQLCYSIQARILDFSGNNISGTIPSCLNNLTTLAQQGNSNLTVWHRYDVNSGYAGYFDIYDDEVSFVWKGALHDYKSILGLVKRIDLSSNRFTGKIPSEITQLVGLVSLNLSRNNLTGEIPPEVGKLKSLDDLDLSRNRIQGPIPTSLSLIDQLSVLDLSHNNLSGEIPVGTQLQRQDESNYAANPLLCGPPLERKCTPEEADQEPQISVNHQGNRVDDELITQEFFLSMGLGFAIGFWAVFGTLLHKYRMWSLILSFFKGLVWQANKNERE